MIRWVPDKPIDMEEIGSLLKESIELRQLTNYGPIVRRLEAKIREILLIDDDKAVVCVTNATHGLWAAAAAFEAHVGHRLRYTTQSHTFPSTAQGFLRGTNIVDVDGGGGLDLNQVQDTDCIFVTNIFGNTVDLDKYVEWARLNKTFLIFDNAATPFSMYKGKNSCNFGHASVVSFHHTKPIGFGEGGCIIIDSQYESTLRKVINFGYDQEHQWSDVGSNYKMSEISAAFILQHLTRFHDIVSTHRTLADYFYRKLTPSVKRFPSTSDEPFVSCFCLLLDTAEDTMKRLNSNGIQARRYYEPLAPTPVANDVFRTILCIPCTADMTTSDLDRIIEIICIND